MTDEQKSDYFRAAHQAKDTATERLTRDALKSFDEQRKARLGKEMETIRAEVALELQALPESMARVSMEMGQARKFSRQDVERIYGSDSAEAKGLAAMGLLSQRGANVSEVAGAWGSRSDAFVQAVLETANLDSLIERESERRLKQRFPELLGTRAVRAMAKQHRANEKRSALLWREVQILRRRAERAEQDASAEKAARGVETGIRREAFTPNETLQQIRDRVALELDQVRLSDLHPNAYLSAAGRESRKSGRLVRVGKFQLAAEAKAKELENLERARIAAKIVKQGVKDRTGILKVQKYFGANAAGTGAHAEATALLERYEFQAATRKQQENRVARTQEALAEWIGKQVELGVPLAAANWVVVGNEKRHHGDLTGPEMTDLRTLLEGIRSAAINRDKLSAAAKRESRSERRRALTAQVSGGGIFSKVPRETDIGEAGRPGKARLVVEGFLADLMKGSVWLRIFDGDRDGGPFISSIGRAMAEVLTTSANNKDRQRLEFERLYVDHFGDDALRSMNDSRDFAGKELTHEERLSILAMWGNPEGRQRLSAWMNSEQVQAVLDAVTKEDAAFVRARWEHYHALHLRAKAAHERISGQTVKSVDHIPFALKIGDETIQMPGGFHPLHYTNEGLLRTEQDLIAEIRKGTLPSQTLDMGFTKARNEKVSGELIPDLSREMQIRYVENVEHVLAVREVVSDVQSMLWTTDAKKEENVALAIREAYGDAALKSVRQWFGEAMIGGSHVNNHRERVLGAIRQRSVVATLGFRLKTMLMQQFGLKQTVTRLGGGDLRVGVKWTSLAVARVFKTKAGILGIDEFVESRSPMMTRRLRGKETFSRDFDAALASSAAKSILPPRNKKEAARRIEENVKEAAFFGILKSQAVQDKIAWYAQWLKTMSERPDGVHPDKWDAEASARADQAVRDTQHGGQPIDLSSFERGAPVERLFTTFFTDASLKFNQMALSASRTNWGSKTNTAQFMADFFVLYFTEVAYKAAFGALLVAAGLKLADDEEDEPNVLQQAASAVIEVIPFFREGSGEAMDIQYRGTIGVQGLVGSARLIGDMLSDDEFDRGTLRALKDATKLVGIPLRAMEDVWDSIEQVMDGEVPLALVGVR